MLNAIKLYEGRIEIVTANLMELNGFGIVRMRFRFQMEIGCHQMQIECQSNFSVIIILRALHNSLHTQTHTRAYTI